MTQLDVDSWPVTAGLGDSNGRSVPTVVSDIDVVGHVSCGSLHSVVLSADGWTVWSFGDGDGGKQCFFVDDENDDENDENILNYRRRD